jgi:hypothetical protein
MAAICALRLSNLLINHACNRLFPIAGSFVPTPRKRRRASSAAPDARSAGDALLAKKKGFVGGSPCVTRCALHAHLAEFRAEMPL